MIVELRSDRCQTLVPPSVHPDGELIHWEQDGEPASADPDVLHRAVRTLAAAALLARHWRGGMRHDAALALGSALLRSGWSEEDAVRFVCRTAEAAGDAEWRDRETAVRDTARKLRANPQEHVTGIPTLKQMLDERIVNCVVEWLGIDKSIWTSAPSRSIETADLEWTAREPLPGLNVPVPLLREELIPEPFRPWVVDAAERLQVPFEFIAVPQVVGSSSVIGRTVGVLPKRKDDWLAIPNLWGAIIGRVGLMKSPALAEGLRPVRRLAARAADEFEDGRFLREAEMVSTNAQLETLKGQMRTAYKKDEHERGSDLKREYEELCREQAESETSARRYTTNDATVPKLAMLLEQNPRGLLYTRDELIGWLKLLDKPGNEHDRSFFLEAWNGYGSFEVDRVERGSSRIDALCVSVLGAIQPSRLTPYVIEATEGGAGDDGLLQRFQMMVWPEHSKEWRDVDRWPDSDARDRVHRVFCGLDRLRPDDLAVERTADSGVPAMRFDDEAQEVFTNWRAVLERRLRSGEIDSHALEGHLAKFRSLMPSLALIFHLVEVVDGGAAVGIPSRCAWQAIEWCRYLEAHANKIYAASWRRDLLAATALARRLERGEVRDGAAVRSIYRKGWAQLSRREDVEAGLELLEQLGWVRLQSIPTEARGRDKEIVRIHPELLSKRAGR